MQRYLDFIARLEQQLNHIAALADASAKKQVSEQLFDRQLFNRGVNAKGQLPTLLDYFDEVQTNIDYLRLAVSQQHVEQVNYLADKIANQLTALYREHATQRLRVSEPKPVQEDRYQTHCRYLDYQRRLVAMQQELEAQLSVASEGQKPTISQKLAALSGRLYRCNRAIAKLERQLESDIVT